MKHYFDILRQSHSKMGVTWRIGLPCDQPIRMIMLLITIYKKLYRNKCFKQDVTKDASVIYLQSSFGYQD